MGQRKLTEEELRLMAFYHQLIALGRDTEVAARLVILRPDGTRFASVSLSAKDLDNATDAIAALNPATYELDEAEAPETDLDEHFAGVMRVMNGLPDPLPEPTEGDITSIVTGFEALLRGEGGQA